MIEGIAQVLLAIGALLLEITVWAIVGLYVAIRSIVSPAHREKIRLEWHSGWKGKASLLFSGAFWVTVVGAAVYIWFPVRADKGSGFTVYLLRNSQAEMVIPFAVYGWRQQRFPASL